MMAQPLKDITGQVFGHVEALEHLGNGRWRCRCNGCGREDYEIFGSDLRRKHAKGRSCGCLSADFQSEGRTTHGASSLPEYRIWKNLKARCYIPSADHFDRYGGRGIEVCEAWRDSFDNFLRDMGHRPSAKHSIERLDLDGHYEKSNCTWATRRVQSRNRSDNVRLTFRGRTQILNDWAAEVGIKRKTISRRLKEGWSVERALTEPPMHMTRWHGDKP